MDMTFTFTSQQAIDLAYFVKRNEENSWLIRMVLAFAQPLEKMRRTDPCLCSHDSAAPGGNVSNMDTTSFQRMCD